MAQTQDPDDGSGNTSMDMTDPVVCWENDIETSSVSSDSSVEHVERNAEKARRRLALEEWVDVDEEDNDDGAGSKCGSECGSENESGSGSEINSESDESEDEGAVLVHVLSRMSARDKLKIREALKRVSRDPTVRDVREELAVSLASLASLGVTDLRNPRTPRGFMTRQESDLGSLESQGETDMDRPDSGSGMAPRANEQCWTDSNSDSDSVSASDSASDLDLKSGDEGDDEVRSVSSGEQAGEDDTAGTPGSSLAASASGTQFGEGCGHELRDE